jgi:hypothetical protein
LSVEVGAFLGRHERSSPYKFHTAAKSSEVA